MKFVFSFLKHKLFCLLSHKQIHMKTAQYDNVLQESASMPKEKESCSKSNLIHIILARKIMCLTVKYFKNYVVTEYVIIHSFSLFSLRMIDVNSWVFLPECRVLFHLFIQFTFLSSHTESASHRLDPFSASNPVFQHTE